MGGINQALYSFLGWIQQGVGSWGVAIIIFTIIVRLVLTPLDIKSRVSMRKTSKLQPQLQALQKKYANDKEKLNQKTAELYKKEHINPLSSCLPLLLTWPILIAVFTAMRMAANAEMLKQIGNLLTDGETNLEQFLWIKNLWMPDNLFSWSVPEAKTLAMISQEQWATWLEQGGPRLSAALAQLNLGEDAFATANLSATANTIVEYLKANNAAYQAAMGEMQNFSIPLLGTIKDPYNGLLLLPILSAVSQIVMTKITSAGQPQQTSTNGQPNTGKLMQWFFPIFSLVICLGYSAAFALYWVSGNLVSMAQTVIINKMLDKKEQQAAAIAGEGNVR